MSLMRRSDLFGFDILDLFDTFFVPVQRASDPVNVTWDEDAKSYYIRTVAPGFSEDELNVSVHGNRVNVSGKQEKKEETPNRLSSSRTAFQKSYVLPRDALMDKLEAEFQNGILLVSVPRQSCPAMEERSIPIKALKEKSE